MFPPADVLITLSVAARTEERVARYQVEVSNPRTKELLALRSRPFHNNCSIDDALVHAAGWLRSALTTLDLGEPF